MILPKYLLQELFSITLGNFFFPKPSTEMNKQFDFIFNHLVNMIVLFLFFHILYQIVWQPLSKY